MMNLRVTGFDWDGGNRAKCQKHGVSIAEIEALKAPSVGVMPRRSTSDDTHPLRTRGNEIDRFFNECAMVTMAPWRGPVDLPDCGRLGSRQGRIGSHRIPPGSCGAPVVP